MNKPCLHAAIQDFNRHRGEMGTKCGTTRSALPFHAHLHFNRKLLPAEEITRDARNDGVVQQVGPSVIVAVPPHCPTVLL